MEDSPKRDPNSLYESIPTKSNQCNAYNAYNAYNNKNEKRDNHCIRIRPSVHRAVKNYCHDARMNLGEFYEIAAMFYVDVNPPPNGSPVVFNKLERKQQNIDDQLREIICVDELQEFLSKAKLVKGTLHVSKKKTAIGILKECSKINKRSDELEALMYEVMEVIR